MSPKKEKPSWKKFSKLRISQGSFSKGVRNIEKGTIRHARKFVSSRLDRLSTVRRSVFGWIFLVSILVAVSATQWLFTRDAYIVSSSASGGTYSEGVLGPLETLNPIFARSSAEKSAAKLLFSGLYSYDSTGNLKSDLAESVSISDDETQYTVKLLPNIKWSDGAPLTANDVVFTTNILRDPSSRSEISGWQVFKVDLIDSRTVKFTLPSIYAPFMHALTFPILPEHALAGVKNSELREQPFNRSPVTSGPFALRMLQDVTADGTKKIAHLVANPNYRHGEPRLERFQLAVYPSRDDIVRALKTNEIMATPEISKSDLPEDTLKLYSSHSFGINDGVYAVFNSSSPLLKSSSLRRALAMSIDRSGLAESLDRSVGSLDGPVLLSQVSGKLPEFPGHDVDKAKAILDEEGWRLVNESRVKDGEQLSIKMVALKGAGFTKTTEELAKVWRKELGIKVDIQIVDPLDPSQSVLQSVLQPRNFDVLVYEFVLGGDPDVYAYWHSTQANASGLNFANYSNAVSDDALSGARSKRDNKYRFDRYEAFSKRWIADLPAIPLYRPKIDYLQSRSVSAIGEGAKLVFPEDRYANVIYWTVGKEDVLRTP